MSRGVRLNHMISFEEPKHTQTEVFHKEDSRQQVPPRSEIKEETQLLPPISLSFFAASLYCSILEDTVTELRCLDELNTELRIMKTMADLHLLLSQKHSVKQPVVTDELEGVDRKNLNKEQYKLVKLFNDRKMVCETLLELYKELGLKLNFTTVYDCVQKARVLSQYREQLQTDDVMLKITRKELSKQIRHQKNSIKSIYYDTDSIIEDLKVKVENAVLANEYHTRYIVRWQNARAEQHLEDIRRKESQPSESLQLYKMKLFDEQRVHSEIEMLGLIKINKKTEEVENCMNKYDDDMEEMDLKIQIQKNEFNVAHEQRQELELTIKTHADLITNWVKFKADREAKRLYEEKMNRAAIVLQAWWRGLLVRMALGPYKVVKGRRGAKKGKKK